MFRSETRIVTTHAGALPRSAELTRLVLAKAAGEEKELDMYIGRTKVSVENDDGETEEAYVVSDGGLSPYARFFDESSSSFQKNPELNKLYIQCQQNFANDMLLARGHVFLNDVYDMLGLERSSAGAVVGWVLDGDGDNHIDFGVYDVRNEHFLKSWEPRVLLDFNVDGVVYDKIEDHKG